MTIQEKDMPEGSDSASTPVFAKDGARATIRLNRPRHLNRLQPEDLGALLALFDRIEADPAVRVLVMTGTGRAFSAGYDLGSIAERAVSASQEDSAGSAFEAVVNRLEDLAVPTICRLNGGVYGGSTDLALACDFRIGIKACEMFMPAARLGLHYYRSASNAMCRGWAPTMPENCFSPLRRSTPRKCCGSAISRSLLPPTNSMRRSMLSRPFSPEMHRLRCAA